MKTLFENLKPEFLEKLEQEAVLYPSVTERTITELKENISWLNLTVNTAQNLCMLNDKNLSIIDLANLFDKNNISLL
jgi:hypothetical protein